MNKLKELRKERGKRQLDVAKDLNLSPQVYCNYENGLREPSYEILKKLADYFSVSVDYLLGRDNSLSNESNSKLDFLTENGISREKLNSLSEQDKQMIIDMINRLADKK